MGKFNQELTDKIVSLMEEDTYTVTEICKIMNIGRKTYYRWLQQDEEFRKAIDHAIESRNEKLAVLARKSLRTKLEGYTLTEVRTIYVPDENDESGWKIKAKIVKEKEYAPDNRAIHIVLGYPNEKEKILQDSEKVLNITISDNKAADLLNEIKEKLKDEERKEQIESEVESTEESHEMGEEVKPEIPEEKKEKIEEKPEEKTESTYKGALPPGYLRHG